LGEANRSARHARARVAVALQPFSFRRP
jgi:hypothetical protein